MKRLKCSRILSLAASAALVFGAAAPAQAQDTAVDSTPISSGGGVFLGGDELAPALLEGNRAFSFEVVLESDGSVSGHCNLTQSVGNRIRFDVNSYDIGADGTCYFVGPITKFTVADPTVPDLVGFTMVCAVQDEGDQTALTVIVPPEVSSPIGLHPFTTLTEIYDYFSLLISLGFFPPVPYGPDMLHVSGLVLPLIPLSAGSVTVEPGAPDPFPNA